MPRYVTVTPASVRSVAATLTARTVAVSRRYLFSSAARANIVAARTIAAALSRGRTALVPVRAARTVVADVVARRALAVAVMGDRLVSAGLGAVRSLAALVSAGRLAVAGMVRRRPGAGTVSASRTVAAVQYRGGVLSSSITGRRDAAVAPYTSVRPESGVLVDSNGANVVDSNGASVDTLEIFTTVSYLRWRVMYPVVPGVRTVVASPVAKRLLSASAAGVRTIAALPHAIRQLAAVFTADPTVPRFTAGLIRRWGNVSAAIAGLRVITAGMLRRKVGAASGSGGRVVSAGLGAIRPLAATAAGSRTISGSLFNLTSMTDSNGDNLIDDSSAPITVLI